MKSSCELEMITKDLEFCISIVNASPKITLLSLPLMPYLSMITVESSAYFNVPISDQDVNEIRAKAKFLDDNKIDTAKTLRAFRRILADHRRHFAKFKKDQAAFQPDVGIFDWNGRFIGTSILYNFFMSPTTSGALLNDLQSGSGYGLSVRVGKYIGELSKKGHVSLDLFKKNEHNIEENIAYLDTFSEDYYSSIFSSALTPEIIQPLQTYLSMLTLVRYVLDDTWVNQTTLFKIRFVTLYHVLRSMQKLQGYFRVNKLSTEKINGIFSQVTSDSFSKLVLSQKRFRNVITHYRIDNHSIQLDKAKTLYGLVDYYFDGYSFPALNRSVDEKLENTIEVLNSWMNSDEECA